MSQIRNLLLSEGALGLLDLPLVFAQQLQHLSEMRHMILQCFTEDENVVKED